MITVLLYYKIIRIKDPESLVGIHKEVCSALQLKGRVLIGKDGINGTVGGTAESIGLYKKYMDQHAKFSGIDFKESKAAENPFPKLKVKFREEVITTLDRENFDIKKTGNYVDRDTFHEWLKRGEDIVIIDMRNDYEWAIGRFKNAIEPPVKYFRELKDQMDFYKKYKDKKIVMYCTGGIRCVPASAMFLAAGFERENIYQLEGGIVKYAEKYGDEGFYEGKCFVFDERMAVPVDTTENAVTCGECQFCNENTDAYRNCLNRHCNKLFLGCADCTGKMQNACSAACKKIIENPEERRPLASCHVQFRNK